MGSSRVEERERNARAELTDWHSLSCGLGAPAMALFASQATWETGNLASSKVMALRTALDFARRSNYEEVAGHVASHDPLPLDHNGPGSLVCTK